MIKLIIERKQNKNLLSEESVDKTPDEFIEFADDDDEFTDEEQLYNSMNGDCGIFAVALFKALAEQGIYGAMAFLIYDALNREPTDMDNLLNSEADIFHICVLINNKFYDFRGEVNKNEVIRKFVPYGGMGLTPKDYTPKIGRDYMVSTFLVNNDDDIEYFDDFVNAGTNVQTWPSAYRRKATEIANKIKNSV
jgi:hypothetical protein